MPPLVVVLVVLTVVLIGLAVVVRRRVARPSPQTNHPMIRCGRRSDDALRGAVALGPESYSANAWAVLQEISAGRALRLESAFTCLHYAIVSPLIALAWRESA